MTIDTTNHESTGLSRRRLLTRASVAGIAAPAAYMAGSAFLPQIARAQDGTPAAQGGTPVASPDVLASRPDFGGLDVAPDMQAVLDTYAQINPISIPSQEPFNARQLPLAGAAVQQLLAEQGAPGIELVGSVTHTLVPGGDGNIVARVYTPEGSGPFPIIVYVHGGGWVIAGLDAYDASCRALTSAANAVVVSLAYRLAPEHPFPAPVDDVYMATQFIMSNPVGFGGEAGGPVAIAGESAGGNMATVTCLRARDEGGRMPVHQLLVYPVTTFMPEGEAAESVQEQANAAPLNQALLEWFGMYYLPDMSAGSDPYASPLMADDLSGLPPATVILAELDPLRSQGVVYAEMLEAAGVDVTATIYEGVTHEFFGMGAVVEAAQTAVAEAAARLQAAFASGTATPTA